MVCVLLVIWPFRCPFILIFFTHIIVLLCMANFAPVQFNES